MDLYNELEVPRDADADTIKKAYRKKAQMYHPDRPNGNPERFRAVQTAYEVLSDPERRKRYDETGQAEEEPPIRTKAMEMLASLLLRLVDMVDVKYSNIVQAMRDDINNTIDKVENMKAEIEEQISRREEVAKRLTKANSGEEDIMFRMVEHDIRVNREKIAGLDQHIALSNEMLSVLKEYTYSFEKGEDAKCRRIFFDMGNFGGTAFGTGGFR